MRARLLLRVLLIPLLAVCRLSGSTAPTPKQPDSPLSVECIHDGRVLRLAGVEGEVLVVSDSSAKALPAPAQARWTVRGDIRAHADLLYWSPDYGLRRDPRRDDGLLRAEVSLVRKIDIAPSREEIKDPDLARWNRTISRDPDPFTARWPGDPDQPGAIVALWIVDGRVTQTEIQPIPQVGRSREFRLEFSFSISPEEARGQPALLLWQRGAIVSANPFSKHAATHDAFRAIAFDDREALAAALAKGAKRPAPPNESRMSLTHYAAESGAISCLSLLLENHSKAMAEATSIRISPLLLASVNDRQAAVALLLDTYARQKKTDSLWVDAIRGAILAGHTDLVGQLIKRYEATHRHQPDLSGADRMIPWDVGYPDLARLIAPDFPTEATVTNPSDRDERLADLLGKHAADGHLPMVRHLLAVIDANAESTGAPALLRAVRAGEVGVARVLLKAGANPDRASRNGTTPLMVASARNDPEFVRDLLDAGAQANASDSQGMTALHFAAASDAATVIPMLLDAGADLQICSIRDATPLDLALLRGSTHAVAPLMDRGACIGLGASYSHELLLAAILHDIDAPLATALEQGWPAGSTFAGIWPAVRLAELFGAEKCAARLRAAGAPSDARLPTPVVAANELDSPLQIDAASQPVDPRSIDAEYPAATVRIRVLVDARGQALFPKVIACPDPDLIPAALAAAQSTHYMSPRRDGHPVAAFAELDLNFAASRDRTYATDEVDTQPRNMRQPLFYLPKSARNLKETSRVEITYVVNAWGGVEQVNVAESPSADCTQAVLLTVAQWKFVPGMIRGKPVAVRMSHSFHIDPKR